MKLLRKIFLYGLIILFSFMIFKSAQNAWVGRQLILLKEDLKNFSLANADSIGKRLEDLSKISRFNDQVWFLLGQYYFWKMQRVQTNHERLLWSEKAFSAATRAVECNPLNSSLQTFRDKTLKWKRAFSKSMRSNTA